jgi:hypothetical protein
VAANVTWKAVARSLGLAQSATPRLQRHARRLGLSTTHFRGRRRWSDDNLTVAVADSKGWAEVIRRLDISDTSDTRIRLKGHAIQLGLDIAHLDPSPPADETTEDLRDRPPDPSRNLRIAAEAIAVAWLTLRGVPVAVPTQQCEYDLLITLSGRQQRVQVKTGTFRGRHGTWQVCVGRRPYVLDKSALKSPYDPDTIDYFFIIDGDGAIYLIPSRVLAGKVAINIGAYERHRVGDASSLLVPPPGGVPAGGPAPVASDQDPTRRRT